MLGDDQCINDHGDFHTCDNFFICFINTFSFGKKMLLVIVIIVIFINSFTVMPLALV